MVPYMHGSCCLMTGHVARLLSFAYLKVSFQTRFEVQKEKHRHCCPAQSDAKKLPYIVYHAVMQEARAAITSDLRKWGQTVEEGIASKVRNAEELPCLKCEQCIRTKARNVPTRVPGIDYDESNTGLFSRYFIFFICTYLIFPIYHYFVFFFVFF